MKTLHKTAISAAAVGMLCGLTYTPAFAEDAPEASPITANVTVVNDYRYRGLTQSNFKPAIQGGFDYAHESGFYIGNWNSSISWIADGYQASGFVGSTKATSAVSAPVEMDFYAGYKKELIGEGFATDVGVLQYLYPTTGIPSVGSISRTGGGTYAAIQQGSTRQASGTDPSTTEAYVAQNFTFGPLNGFAKFSYALTPIFGIYNSKGSYYPDLTINYDLGVAGIVANAHIGYQYVAGNYTNYNFSYTDWKLGFTKDFGGGLSAAVAYVGTNAQTVAGRGNSGYVYATPSGSNQGKAGGLISLTKTF